MEMHHFMICCHNYGMETVCLLNKSDHDTAALSTLSRDSFIQRTSTGLGHVSRMLILIHHFITISTLEY